ncbi:DUF4124 domain-containing protein [Acinetobacter guillouiae]|uniref:DUF4124 domain-containing protein n=1 Tax=Acinetobacter guillouiae TaxID=106649 RepID=UPI0026E350A3|nr:DUF4124 domain-containing protein [Acinetobacter guillouiae]MDO6645414.1 DUF4124 domain-containing protein [Acinetobacter guillouiae]
MSVLQKTLKISFILFSLYSTTLYAKNIYKWIDDKGNVKYSRKVPPNGQEVGRVDDINKIVAYRARPNTTMPTKEAMEKARELKLAKLDQKSTPDTINPIKTPDSTCLQIDGQKKCN